MTSLDAGLDRGAVTDGRARRVTITPSSVALLVGAVFVAFILRSAFVAAHAVIGWVVACSIVALLIDPVVGFVDRYLPRWLSVIVVLLSVLSVVAAVVIGLVSDVSDSVEELRTAVPEAAAQLEERYTWAADVGIAERAKSLVDDLDEASPDPVSLAERVPTYLVTGILMLFILGYGRRYFNGFVEQFDARRQPAIREVVGGAAKRGQAYLLIALGHATVNGVIVGLVCWSLDLPAARSLGVAVGLFTVLPLMGVLIGGVPALLLAFGLEGWQTGLIVLGVLVVLQVVEAAVVRPFVDPRTVRLGPTVPIVVGLVGFALYGPGGAVYGIALAVIGLAALDEIGRRIEPARV